MSPSLAMYELLWPSKYALTDPSTLPATLFFLFTPLRRQELKDARKVMPAAMGMPTSPLSAGRAGASTASALAFAGGSNGGDGGVVARALSAPGSGPSGAGGGEAESAAAAAVEGHNGSGLSHVEKLEIRAAEIMQQVLGLATFCERAGASKELEVSVKATTVPRWCA